MDKINVVVKAYIELDFMVDKNVDKDKFEHQILNMIDDRDVMTVLMAGVKQDCTLVSTHVWEAE